MKHTYQRFLALLLALALTGCSSIGPERNGTEEAQVPTGRYVEERLPLPAGMQKIIRLERADDGALYLFGSAGSGSTGPWGLWISQDDGDSWSEETYPWVEELNGIRVRQMAMSGDKLFYVVYDGQEDGGYRLATASTGSLEEKDYPLEEDDYGFGVVELLPGQDGSLILVCPLEIRSVDSGTGEVLRSIYTSREFILSGEAGAGDGSLYLSVQGEILRFDLETGAESAGLVASPRSHRDPGAYEAVHGHRVLAVGEADGAVYYCDDGGLYRTLPGSPVTELLLGGERCSLGMSSLVPHRLLVLPGDRYLVLAEDSVEGNVLYRYAFDSTVPLEPSVNLRVYSLSDNPTIRQAAGEFQRQVSQVKVTFQVGAEKNSGVGADDALRTLSAEILAGDGPDVLVLDGMPLDSYARKGVLLELGERMDGNLQGGGYLDNIVDTYRTGDGLFAVPARFTVPMLLAPGSARDVHSLQELADWLEAQEEPSMKYTFPAALLEQLYAAEYSGFLRQDGSLDEAAYIRYLENIRRLTRCQGILNSWEGLDYVDAEEEAYNIVAWAGGLITAHISELDSLYIAALAHQATEERGDGTYQPLGGVYIPRTILGINANGSQTELALLFLETALSPSVLTPDFGDGLPVHREALGRNMENPRPNEEYVEQYWTFWEDVDAAELDFAWPAEDFFAGFLDRLSSLHAPVHSSDTVRALVMEQSLLCLDGDKSPEEAARDLDQVIGRLAAEQG